MIAHQRLAAEGKSECMKRLNVGDVLYVSISIIFIIEF